MDNLKTKMTKVQEDRIELLRMIKERLVENKDNLNTSLKMVDSVLATDEENTKKYNAIKKAEELIMTLSEQIVNCNSQEEVVELRKKLNYYINKIKNELRKRNVREETINEYQNSVGNLRKSISVFIRFAKREKNLMDFEDIFRYYDRLSKDQKKDLRKRVNLENDFNCRNKEILLRETKNDETRDMVISGEDIISDDNITIDDVFEQDDALVPSEESFEYLSYEEALKRYQEEIVKFEQKYGIKDTHDYRKHKFLGNLGSLIYNIPRNIVNLKTLKMVDEGITLKDKPTYYQGIFQYLKNRNTISNALKAVFQKSHLYNRKMRYLNNHNQCSRWLDEFYKNTPMNLRLIKKNLII